MLDFEKMRNVIKEKGLIAPDVVDKMTINEMIEHLLRYRCLGEIWIPEVHHANHTK